MPINLEAIFNPKVLEEQIKAAYERPPKRPKITNRSKYLRRLTNFHNSKLSTKTDRIRALQKIAKYKVGAVLPKDLIARRRAFNAKKYRLLPLADCFVCYEQARHRHHLVQLQHGGTNISDNLVGLCELCHQMVHPFMMALWEEQELNERLAYLIEKD